MAVLARGVVAGYGGAPVLDGISLDVGPGDAIGLIGRSGAGKTTLLEVLAGAIAPSRGTVTFDGRQVFRPKRRDRKAVHAGLRSVHQNGLAGIDPTHTVDRVLRTALDDARSAGRSTGRDVAAALDLVALPAAWQGRRVGTLSGGERQRLALAAALAPRPDVALLDEPLTAVDPGMRRELAQVVAAVAHEEGVGLLVASHDMALLDVLTRQVHVLADGTFVESGPLRAVLANPRHPDTKDLVDALPEAGVGLR